MMLLALIAFLVSGIMLPAYGQVPASAPILVLLPNEGAIEQETKTWREVAQAQQWHFLAPAQPVIGDPGVKTLDTLVTDARKQNQWSGPAYAIGAGPQAAMVLYAATRAPHLFTAVLAIGGSPKPAIESDRLFAGNLHLVPVAWAVNEEEKRELALLFQKMNVAGVPLTILEKPTVKDAAAFFGKAVHQPQPRKVDCETGNPTLARCYWITPVQFDPALRNDALRTTRISPDMTASLDLGGFGYKIDAKGPGVLVEFLPPNYKGPLEIGDRIVSLSGKPIADARHYVELMGEIKEEKPVSVMIDRKGERFRQLTNYQLRKREEVTTARIQAEYSPEAKEIVIVSRTVAAARIEVPPQWIPAAVNWNGVPVATIENPGCYQISLKNPGQAVPCPTPGQ